MAVKTIETKAKAVSQQASASAMEMFQQLNLEIAGLAAKEAAPAAAPKPRPGKRAPVYSP